MKKEKSLLEIETDAKGWIIQKAHEELLKLLDRDRIMILHGICLEEI
jgi:hypothetical protein